MKAVKEAAFKDAFCTMVNKLIYVKNRVLKPMLKELNTVAQLPMKDNAKELDKLDAQAAMLQAMMEEHGVSSSVILPELIKIEETKEKLCLVNMMASNDNRIEALRELINICDRGPLQTEFSNHIFSAIVDKVSILSKKEILFELKCGLRLKERLVRA